MNVSASDKRADRLFDLLEPLHRLGEGLPSDELMARLDCNHRQFSVAVRELRMIVSEDSTMWVVCDPDPKNPWGPWIYRLVDGEAVVNVEESTWAPSRISDAETRLKLLARAMNSAKRGTKPHTVLGRKARHMERELRHLVEDLEAMGVETY